MSCFREGDLCPIDDSGKCCGKHRKLKIFACVPVHGRLPLLKHTIERLVNKNKVEVICVGDGHEERKVCEKAGASWVQFRNRPLGAKWNAAFVEAGRKGADACLFVGSSDWLSDNWCSELSPMLHQYDMLGTLGCHFLDISKIGNRLVYWPGYNGSRAWESIGIGRLLSKRILDKIDWKPFNDSLDSGLDSSMSEKIKRVGGASSHSVINEKIVSVSISTDQWQNLHKFNMHWMNLLPSQRINDVDSFIDKNFPEAKMIFHAGAHI